MTTDTPTGTAEMIKRPELLRLYQTPWYVSADGVKTANGVWVMSASNSELAHKIADLANYAGQAADALEAAERVIAPFAEAAEGTDGQHATDDLWQSPASTNLYVGQLRQASDWLAAHATGQRQGGDDGN